MTHACEGLAYLRNKDVSLILNNYTGEEYVQLLQDNRLTVNHRMKDAGTMGKAVHEVMALWSSENKLYTLETYPEEYRPRIHALQSFLVENEPEVLESECITGSIEYQYAGTFDLKALFRKGEYKGQIGLIDQKNTKRVYKDQHFPQLEAYKRAEEESGETPMDFTAVLHLGEDGKYSLVESTDTFEDFKVLVYHYRSIERRTQREKAEKAAKKLRAKEIA